LDEGRLYPPGWKPRLYGRQDARRYGRGAAGTEAKAPCRADLSRRSRSKAEVKRRRKRGTTEIEDPILFVLPAKQKN